MLHAEINLSNNVSLTAFFRDNIASQHQKGKLTFLYFNETVPHLPVRNIRYCTVIAIEVKNMKCCRPRVASSRDTSPCMSDITDCCMSMSCLWQATVEQRKLAVDLAEVIVKWECQRMKEESDDVSIPQVGNTPVPTHH